MSSDVYLHLFHGRKTPDELLDDWGSDGPVIGPLRYIHVTYMCAPRVGIRRSLVEQFFPTEHQRMLDYVAENPNTTAYQDPDEIEDIWFKLDGDLIEHEGVYYGDWSIGGSELFARDFNAS